MENYYLVSDYGKTIMPSQSELLKIFENHNEQVVLVLDSSVCMDIINLVKRKKEAHCDKHKVFNLIEYVQRNGVEYFALFALLESCYDRTTLKIQSEKFFDFKNMIDYAFKYPVKKLKRFEYNFMTDCVFLKNPEINTNVMDLLVSEHINIYYAALLKIYEIAQNGLEKNKAEKNIDEFINWMQQELKIVLGLEYSLALGIFGGNSKLRSMIKIGSSKDKILKSAWGTAWDLFHSRVSRNREQLSDLMSKNVHPIFVTKDSYLFNLISPPVDYYAKFDRSKLSVGTLNEETINYSNEFMEKLNERILKLTEGRKYKTAEIDINKLSILIRDLENNIK